MEPIVKVEHLYREYRVKQGLFKKEKSRVEAVRDLSFEVYKGEIFGLLGPNGAGKSTTIKILSTMLLPTAGKVEIAGCDIYTEEQAIRTKINFIFGGERSLYFRLTAADNLYYFADLYQLPRSEQVKMIPELLELVGLGDVGNRRVETFSKGMKQRLQIARALLNQPEIIFLDEPSIGLDPIGALELRNLVKKLAQQGKTILLTTHYMAEAEELCDRIAIINHGEMLTCGTLEEIASLVTDEEKATILEEKAMQQSELDVTLEDIYLKLVGRV
ncbi:ABC transporter [Streptococcus cuniculi]|uniref:ABC transporter n=1 Tax=Streptococcus cuniculi TaxID=1432788 RepID=A0A1Q8E5Z4_9STRE|nr:ABC transporter ATP-binding protein [Streptococcus cuniculi]OLF47225.1 ABC transporter [Streptococcus cuniculi]